MIRDILSGPRRTRALGTVIRPQVDFATAVKRTAATNGLDPELSEIQALISSPPPANLQESYLRSLFPRDYRTIKDGTFYFMPYGHNVLRPWTVADYFLGNNVIKSTSTLIKISPDGVFMYDRLGKLLAAFAPGLTPVPLSRVGRLGHMASVLAKHYWGYDIATFFCVGTVDQLTIIRMKEAA